MSRLPLQSFTVRYDLLRRTKCQKKKQKKTKRVQFLTKPTIYVVEKLVDMTAKLNKNNSLRGAISRVWN